MEDIIIPVNEIIEQEKTTMGLSVWNETVKETLMVIYKPEKLVAILQLAKEHPVEGIYFQDRFCQFIVLVQLKLTTTKPFIDGSIKLLDCHNDLDAALDEYRAYRDNQWNEGTINDFMRLFQEIEKDKSGSKATMKITFHIPG